MADENSLIRKIIDVIKIYYPTDDSDIIKKDLLKYQALVKIVEDKMAAVINNTMPSNISNLLNDLRMYFDTLDVIDEFHLQFPSYSISIQLKEQNIEYIKVSSFIRIKVSLVYSCFTVFYEEMSTFENFSRFRPIVFRILSSKNGNLDSDSDNLNTIITLIKKHFPDYEYINHQMLFFNRLSHIFPYNYQKNNEIADHSLYNFLFDDIYNSGNIEITF